MNPRPHTEPAPRPELEPHDRPELEYYRNALGVLNDAGMPYLVGGAYAYAHYTNIHRHTKDCDIFVRREDLGDVLDVLRRAGYRTEVTFTHWLGKAFCGDYLIDVIFSSGNGLCRVDDAWFMHAVDADLLGVPVRLCAPEEMIWSKAFIMERERYDGSDVNHLLHECGPRLDWDRLVARFGTHWRVLLAHLIMFSYAYPEPDRVPRRVLEELLARAAVDRDPTPPGVGHGTLLSRQYNVDVERHGYEDGRLAHGGMTAEELARWTAAFPDE